MDTVTLIILVAIGVIYVEVQIALILSVISYLNSKPDEVPLYEEKSVEEVEEPKTLVKRSYEDYANMFRGVDQ